MFRTAVFIASMMASSALPDASFSYLAQIDGADIHNSNGKALRDIAAILQQDRANIHRFGNIAEGDESDPFFGDFRARAQMPHLYQPGPREEELEALMGFVSLGAVITLHVEVCLEDEKPARLGVQYINEHHSIC